MKDRSGASFFMSLNFLMVQKYARYRCAVVVHFAFVVVALVAAHRRIERVAAAPLGSDGGLVGVSLIFRR